MNIPIVSKEYKNIIYIYDPVFRENLYFFKATNHKDFFKAANDEFKGINLDEYFTDIIRNGKTYGGFLGIENKEKVIIFCIWCERKLDSLVHEVYHLVWRMLDDRGIKDNETGAYLMGFFVKEITKYLKFR